MVPLQMRRQSQKYVAAVLDVLEMAPQDAVEMDDEPARRSYVHCRKFLLDMDEQRFRAWEHEKRGEPSSSVANLRLCSSFSHICLTHIVSPRWQC